MIFDRDRSQAFTFGYVIIILVCLLVCLNLNSIIDVLESIKSFDEKPWRVLDLKHRLGMSILDATDTQKYREIL